MFYLFLSIREEFSNILFGCTDIFVQNLGTVDNLRLARIQHLSNLPGHESFACTRRSEQQYTCLRLVLIRNEPAV